MITSIILFIIILLLTTFFRGQFEMESIKNGFFEEKPVKDILLENIPRLPQEPYTLINDFLTAIPFIVLVLASNKIALKLFFKIGSIAYLIRLISMTFIKVPKPDQFCVAKPFPTYHFCMDAGISGHTIFCLLPLLILLKFNLINTFEIIILTGIYFLHEYLKLATRHHYTIDCLAAVILVNVLILVF